MPPDVQLRRDSPRVGPPRWLLRAEHAGLDLTRCGTRKSTNTSQPVVLKPLSRMDDGKGLSQKNPVILTNGVIDPAVYVGQT